MILRCDRGQGNRVLIESALLVPIIPAKAGIQSDSAGADIPVAKLDRFPLSREDSRLSRSFIRMTSQWDSRISDAIVLRQGRNFIDNSFSAMIRFSSHNSPIPFLAITLLGGVSGGRPYAHHRMIMGPLSNSVQFSFRGQCCIFSDSTMQRPRLRRIARAASPPFERPDISIGVPRWL